MSNGYDHDLIIALRKARLGRIKAEERLSLILIEIETGKMGRELLDAIHARQQDLEAAESQELPAEVLTPEPPAEEPTAPAPIPPAKPARRGRRLEDLRP